MPAKWLITGALLVAWGMPALAEEPKESPVPDLELLEFLGTWETADGEWFDPLSLENVELMEAPEAGKEDSGPHDRSRQEEKPDSSTPYDFGDPSDDEEDEAWYE